MQNMKFEMQPLYEISQKIWNDELRYADTVLIGDNSSGKSLLLKLIVEQAGETNGIYFIDAVNRGFVAEKVIREDRKPEYNTAIVKTRLKEQYFNMQDSFSCFGTSTERVEEIYFLYEPKLQELFFELTKTRFQIIPGTPLGEVEFEQGRGLLSSGYQALVRIFLELLYYQEKCVEEKGLERAKVVIDELDEFLSPGFASRIFPFLKEHFPKMEFIVATHSCDLVAGAENANLVILDDSGFEVLDVNDYSSVSEVQIIFERVFGVAPRKEDEVEGILRRLFNNKLNNAWTRQDQQQLEKLQEESLTASQQLICRQIMEW